MLKVIKTVNGITIKNLLHLVEVFHDSEDKFITIEFFGYGAESLVFPREEMIDATEEILNDNGIRTYASPDAMGVWKHTNE